MRVLIVEDEPNLGRQLRATLEGAGYAVDQVGSGNEADAALADHEFEDAGLVQHQEVHALGQCLLAIENKFTRAVNAGGVFYKGAFPVIISKVCGCILQSINFKADLIAGLSTADQ